MTSRKRAGPAGMRLALWAAAVLLGLAAGGLALTRTSPAPTVRTGSVAIGTGAGAELPREQQSASPAAPAVAPPARRVRLAAVGDLLMHLPLVQEARLPGNADYDFTPIFAPSLPILQEADLAVANLETTLAGPAWPLAGYPTFNTPPEFARDLRRMGFDLVTNANNHSLDYGQRGLENTIDYLDQHGLLHTGTFKTPAERDRPLIVERSGLRIAFLAYTYGTNGISVPEPHHVNLINPELIRHDIATARAAADFVSVSLHFGVEDARHPGPGQQDLVRTVIAAGADLVLGSHPHVLQPIEWVEAGGRRGLVIYSLGNFVSNQYGLANNTGVILLVDIEQQGSQPAVPVDATYALTYSQQQRRGGLLRTRVLPLAAALEDAASGLDPLPGSDDHLLMRQTWADHVEHMRGSSSVRVYHHRRPVTRLAPVRAEQ